MDPLINLNESQSLHEAINTQMAIDSYLQNIERSQCQTPPSLKSNRSSSNRSSSRRHGSSSPSSRGSKSSSSPRVVNQSSPKVASPKLSPSLKQAMLLDRERCGITSQSSADTSKSSSLSTQEVLSYYLQNIHDSQSHHPPLSTHSTFAPPLQSALSSSTLTALALSLPSISLAKPAVRPLRGFEQQSFRRRKVHKPSRAVDIGHHSSDPPVFHPPPNHLPSSPIQIPSLQINLPPPPPIHLPPPIPFHLPVPDSEPALPCPTPVLLPVEEISSVVDDHTSSKSVHFTLHPASSSIPPSCIPQSAIPSSSSSLTGLSSFSSSSSSSASRLSLSYWGIPPSIIQLYRSFGVDQLYPWQSDLLSRVYPDPHTHLPSSFIFSAPTSGGKTIIAEFFIIKSLLMHAPTSLADISTTATTTASTTSQSQIIFALPYISLVVEKTRQLTALLRPLGKVVRASHSAAVELPKWQDDIGVDVVVCTFEKANSHFSRLIETQQLHHLRGVIIDEIHMIDDPQRGYILESLLSKLNFIRSQKSDARLNPKQDTIQQNLDTSSLPPHNNAHQIPILGMSATLADIQRLSQWLHVQSFTSDYRPIELTEYLLFTKPVGSAVAPVLRKMQPGWPVARDLTTSRHQMGIAEFVRNDLDLCGFLAVECMRQRQGVLVFCATKKAAEDTCCQLKEWTRSYLEQMKQPPLLAAAAAADLIAQLGQLSNGELPEKLLLCIQHGAAYHHAGLTVEQRQVVEDAFRRGTLLLLACTSTLAAGVNLPARRVIIRGAKIAGTYIDATRYQQMAGRAGRKGQDTLGESILVAPEQDAAYLNSLFVPKKVAPAPTRSISAPASTATGFTPETRRFQMMARGLLEIVSLKLAVTAAAITEFVRASLAATEIGPATLHPLTIQCLRWLRSHQLLECIDGDTASTALSPTTSAMQRSYCASPLGQAIVASSLTPTEGILLHEELSRARRHFNLETDLYMVYHLTPLNMSAELEPMWPRFFQWHSKLPKNHPIRRACDVIGISNAFLHRCANIPPSRQYELRPGLLSKESQTSQLFVHRRFWRALMVYHLIRENSLFQVACDFNLPPGTLQQLKDTAVFFAHMVAIFVEKLKWSSLKTMVLHFSDRLHYGVDSELLELIKCLPDDVSNHDARALYDHGLVNPYLLSKSSVDDLTRVLLNARPYHGSLDAMHAAATRRCVHKIATNIAHAIAQLDFTAHVGNPTHPSPLSLTASSSSSATASTTASSAEELSTQKTSLWSEMFHPTKWPFAVKFFPDQLNGISDALLAKWKKASLSWIIVPSTATFGPQSLMGLVLNLPSHHHFYFLELSTTSDQTPNWRFLRDLIAHNPRQVVPFLYNQIVAILNVFPAILDDLRLHPNLVDPVIAHWMLGHCVVTSNLSLPELVSHYLPSQMLPTKALYQPYLGLEMVHYAGVLMPHLVPLLEAHHLVGPFRSMEMPVVPLLAEMTCRGVSLDLALLARLRSSLAESILSIEARLRLELGPDFNAHSTKSIRRILPLKLDHSDLALISDPRHPEVIHSDKEYLQLLAPRYPFVNLLLRLRSLATLNSHAELLADHAQRSPDLRIHSIFSSHQHETGRLVATLPNLLCLPKDLKLDADFCKISVEKPLPEGGHYFSLRSAFKSAPNHFFACLDYAQIELRLIAHFSQDPSLMAAFQAPGDVFRTLAGCWMNKPSQDINQQERAQVKEICYGLSYGMGLRTLARKLQVDMEDAQKLRAQFDQRFPGLSRWSAQAHSDLETTGYVTTLGGRKRFFKVGKMSNPRERATIGRQGINTICQGSAADIIKVAMVAVRAKWPHLRLLLQFHDELIFELAPDQTLLLQEIATIMESSFKSQLSVPLKVAIKIGPSWESKSCLSVHH